MVSYQGRAPSPGLIIADVDFKHLAEVTLVRSVHYQVTVCIPFHRLPFVRMSQLRPPTGLGSHASPPCGANGYTHPWSSSVLEVGLFSPMSLFIQSFVYIRTFALYFRKLNIFE